MEIAYKVLGAIIGYLWGAPLLASANTPKQEEEIELYQPSNQAIINSTAVVLSRLEKKDPGVISPAWREKLQKGQLTVSDAIGLIYVALKKGIDPRQREVKKPFSLILSLLCRQLEKNHTVCIGGIY
jgi:hypothetical protein